MSLVPTLGSCQAIVGALVSLSAFAAPASIFLMYLRVRAVYAQYFSAVVFFTLLWLLYLGASIGTGFPIPPFATITIGNVSHCFASSATSVGGPRTVLSTVVGTVVDTIMFFAISIKVIGNNTFVNSWAGLISAFYRADAMGLVSKGLLRSGQVYYLCVLLIFTLRWFLTQI